MELSQVIKIAQAHLNGENISLEDVLKTFHTFIEESTPLGERVYCIAEKSLAYVWAEAESRNLLITDQEAVDFLKEFYIYSDGVITTVEEEFDLHFEGRFENAPRDSLFAEAIKANNLEKTKAILDYGRVDLNSSIDNGSDDELTPLELAVRHNSKEIVELLLQSGAEAEKELIDRAVNVEIKRLLEDADKN